MYNKQRGVGREKDKGANSNSHVRLTSVDRFKHRAPTASHHAALLCAFCCSSVGRRVWWICDRSPPLWSKHPSLRWVRWSPDLQYLSAHPPPQRPAQH